MGYPAKHSYEINKRLKQFIENEGKRPTAIADKSGMRRDVFSRIMQSKRPLYADEVVAICRASGISISELLGAEPVRTD